MFSHSRLVFALLSLAPLLARADLKLDSDDISSTCSSICRPVYDLSQTCDVDDDRVPSQLTEDALNLQCLCTNSSFDVAGVTALCASCMQQNPTRDDDGSVDTDDIYEDMEDINEIMLRCGFSSTSYAASQSTAANGVTVAATRPTDSSQLTTTIVGGVGSSPTATATTTPTGTALTSTTGTSTPTAASDSSSSAASGIDSVAGLWTMMTAYTVGLFVLGLWAY